MSPAATPADEARAEALTVAMALAPGVYARNRMFSLFKNPAVQRAKSRAATLRGIVKHLVRACAVTVSRDTADGEGRTTTGETDFVLRYQIPALRLTRVAELSRVELATLRVLSARAGASCLLPEDEDRTLVETTLTRLLAGEGAWGEASTLARAARDASTPPPSPE